VVADDHVRFVTFGGRQHGIGYRKTRHYRGDFLSGTARRESRAVPIVGKGGRRPLVHHLDNVGYTHEDISMETAAYPTTRDVSPLASALVR